MTQQEFETRTGLTVSEETYQTIDALYMSTVIDKDEFCAAYTEGMENNPIVADLIRRVAVFKKSSEAWRKDAEKAAEKAAHYLLDARADHDDETLFNEACDIINAADAIRYMIDNEYELGKPELDYIKENLK